MLPDSSPSVDAGPQWCRTEAAQIRRIPLDLHSALAPATHYLYEWTDYWLECPGADHLRVGDSWHEPVAGTVFHVRFENRLGLTILQPFKSKRPLGPPLHIEVISPKFPTPGEHLAFFRPLLDDLFARAARLPFSVAAPTARGVTESLRPPTPLFTLHFLCQYAATLRAGLAVVQAAPHRELCDHPEIMPLMQATEADADVLLGVLRAPEEWVWPATHLPLAARLGGHAPANVWQRRPRETLDTPPNRFVLAFLRQVLAAAEALPDQTWWGRVGAERQQVVRNLAGLLRQALQAPPFTEVGPLHHFPYTSQVLLQREGYRELLELWQAFQHARQPLFADLRQAMDVRDIATLYETWAFFALVEAIAVLLGKSPAVDLRVSDEPGLGWEARAHYGAAGTLVYNRWHRPPASYSVSLRPDFTWLRDGRAELVFDAKFRLERWSDTDVDDDTPLTSAKRADLYKMHAYRDALDVRAAVALYPGTASVFYDSQGHRVNAVSLRQLLVDREGIGALAMNPGVPSAGL